MGREGAEARGGVETKIRQKKPAEGRKDEKLRKKNLCMCFVGGTKIKMLGAQAERPLSGRG